MIYNDEDEFDPSVIQTKEGLEELSAKNREEKLKRLIRTRKEAYSRIFQGRALPGDATFVMDDIKRFCRYNRTTWHPNQRFSDLLLGRQEVMLRIIQLTEWSVDELYAEYTRQPEGQE